ncbi:DUF2141 domain-containing protein [Sphingomonas sp. PB4P5]|uniref:DUF2141 domain-containing protein n=1 Tax=Parasphingomonas puruogangriensis TaxID=3096155 RepID=UPI002FC621E6
MRRWGIALALAGLPLATPAMGAMLGEDAGACRSGGPAIRVDIVGLKDRTGGLKLELYPATTADFLKDDRDLHRQGKTFRRIRVATPPGGPISLCISVPQPGRYALLLTHDRDGKNKFNFWTDGAGFPSNAKLGRTRPKLEQAIIDVPRGVTTTAIRLQYLRGLAGFAPLKIG